MRKEMKRMTAWALSLCMVMTLLTVVPVSAQQEVKLNGVTYVINEDIANGGLVVFNSFREWNAKAQKDLITGIEGEGYGGRGLQAGEEQIVYIAKLTDGTLAPVTGDAVIQKEDRPVESKYVSVAPLGEDDMAEGVNSSGFYLIKVSKEAAYGDYEIFFGEDSINLHVDSVTQGWYRAIPQDDATLRSEFISNSESFRYTDNNRTLYFVYRQYPEIDSYGEINYNRAEWVPAEWNSVSSNYIQASACTLYTDLEDTQVPLGEGTATATAESDITIGGLTYKVVKVTLGYYYDGQGIYIPLIKTNFKTYDEEQGEVVEDKDRTDEDCSFWVECFEGGLGINDNIGENWNTKRLDRWVEKDEEWGTISCKLFYDGKVYDGSTATMTKPNDKSVELTLDKGVFSYFFNEIGEYWIGTGNAEDGYAIVNVIPRAADFYKEADDISSWIPDHNMNMASNDSGYTVYVYRNPDCMEWNEETKQDVPYQLSNLIIRPNVEEGSVSNNDISFTNGKPDANSFVSAVSEKDNWYEVTVPAKIDGKTVTGFNIELSAQGVEGNQPYGESLNVRVIGDGAYVCGLPDSQGNVSNWGDYLGEFPQKRQDVTFKIATTSVSGNTITYNPIKEIDKSKLKIKAIGSDGDETIGEERVKISTEDGGITLHFDCEGEYSIFYDDNYVGNIRTYQEGMAFYTQDTRPFYNEIITYAKDGILDCKEKQGTASVNLFAWVWDEKQNNQAWINDAGQKGKPTIESAVDYILGNEKDDALNNAYSAFLASGDMDSLVITVITASGKEISGEGIKDYITTTPITDAGGFNVGEKIEVSPKAKEGFTIKAEIESNAKKANAQLKGNWSKVGDLSWAVDKKENAEYAVKVSPITGIKIAKKPAKTSYTEGDKLDVSGLSVAATYEDGKDDYSLSDKDYTITPSGELKTSDKKVTVTYNDNSKFTASYDITVAAKAKDPTPDNPVNPSGDNKKTSEETKTPAATGTEVASSNAADKSEYKVTSSDATAPAVEYEGTKDTAAKTVIIPNTVTDANGVTYSVTKIADNALKGNTTVKEVTVGNNIVEIGEGAFQNATKLTTVKLGSNVTTIDKNAFAGCTKLKKVTASGSKITTVAESAFKGNKALTTIDFSKSKVKTIGKNAFAGDKKLKTLKFNGNALKSVGKNAFKGIKKNAKITVYAKDKKTYNKIVKKLKKAGAKKAKYTFKKKK